MSIPFLPCIPRLLLVIGLILLASPMGPALAAAQWMQALQEGETIRFLTRDSDRHVEGRLVEATREALHIDVDGEVREVAAFELRELEVQRGTRRMTGKGALIGFATGASLGLLIQIPHITSELDGGAELELWALGIALPVIGTLVGSLYRADRWVTVAPVIGTAAGGTGSGLAISLSF